MGLCITVGCETAAVSLVFALLFGTDSRTFQLFKVVLNQAADFLSKGSYWAKSNPIQQYNLRNFAFFCYL